MTFFARFLLLASLAVGCASTTNKPGQHPVYPPSEISGPSAKCEKFCDVQVVAGTVETFCDALLEKTRALVGDKATCKAQGPLGVPTRDEAVVRDAMVVDVVVPDDARYSLVTLRTERGWELAGELGAVRGAAIEQPDSLKIVGVRPVDAPELKPFGVEIRVRIQAQGDSVDRVFVCGRKGDVTTCPRAVVAS
ncbi:MAG: hypothetical protein HYV09_14105 [Deltaproteobacteria bacterium]|nr:hypothetical protein [Deltaproteobacteria bacterium]